MPCRKVFRPHIETVNKGKYDKVIGIDLEPQILVLL